MAGAEMNLCGECGQHALVCQCVQCDRCALLLDECECGMFEAGKAEQES